MHVLNNSEYVTTSQRITDVAMCFKVNNFFFLLNVAFKYLQFLQYLLFYPNIVHIYMLNKSEYMITSQNNYRLHL